MEELYLTVYSELVSVAPMSIITSKTQSYKSQETKVVPCKYEVCCLQ